MSDFTEKLRLKGMAEEDLYFARKDRELIAARKKLDEAKKHEEVSAGDAPSVAKSAMDSNEISDQKSSA